MVGISLSSPIYEQKCLTYDGSSALKGSFLGRCYLSHSAVLMTPVEGFVIYMGAEGMDDDWCS